MSDAKQDANHLPIYVSLGITAVGVAAFAAFANWNGLRAHIDPSTITNVLAPLVLAATFIERAVEVVISPWRDTQADQLSDTADAKKTHAKVKTAAAAAATIVSSGIDPANSAAFTVAATAANAATVEAVAANQAAGDAADAFAQYKGKTKQYAYAVALAFGLLIAYVGVRALSSFYDLPPAQPQSSQPAQAQAAQPQPSPFQNDGQRLMFNVVDVILSAALLAGGANGIHSIVNSFTTFFDTNAQKMQNSGKNP